MSEYSSVEKPFLDKLRQIGWNVIDHGPLCQDRCRLKGGRLSWHKGDYEDLLKFTEEGNN